MPQPLNQQRRRTGQAQTAQPSQGPSMGSAPTLSPGPPPAPRQEEQQQGNRGFGQMPGPSSTPAPASGGVAAPQLPPSPGGLQTPGPAQSNQGMPGVPQWMGEQVNPGVVQFDDQRERQAPGPGGGDASGDGGDRGYGAYDAMDYASSNDPTRNDPDPAMDEIRHMWADLMSGSGDQLNDMMMGVDADESRSSRRMAEMSQGIVGGSFAGAMNQSALSGSVARAQARNQHALQQNDMRMAFLQQMMGSREAQENRDMQEHLQSEMDRAAMERAQLQADTQVEVAKQQAADRMAQDTGLGGDSGQGGSTHGPGGGEVNTDFSGNGQGGENYNTVYNPDLDNTDLNDMRRSAEDGNPEGWANAKVELGRMYDAVSNDLAGVDRERFEKFFLQQYMETGQIPHMPDIMSALGYTHVPGQNGQPGYWQPPSGSHSSEYGDDGVETQGNQPSAPGAHRLSGSGTKV